MITAVAVCPHPPILVPAIAGGAAGELDDLRAACDDAVRELLASQPEQLLVIGAAGPPIGLRAFAPGLAGLPDDALPLSLAIGSWLVGRVAGAGSAQLVAVRPDGTPVGEWPAATTASPSAATALLVMADGSARRALKSPGYLDERAEPFDAVIVKAIAEADIETLAAIDERLAAELLVAGVGALKALAELARGAGGGARGAWRVHLRYDAAPYGVQYTVASWTRA